MFLFRAFLEKASPPLPLSIVLAPSPSICAFEDYIGLFLPNDNSSSAALLLGCGLCFEARPKDKDNRLPLGLGCQENPRYLRRMTNLG